MEFLCLRGSDWLRAVAIAALAGITVALSPHGLHGQTSALAEKVAARPCAVKDVRSRHFLIHTDLARDEADEVVERLEVMLGQFSRYWGKPLRGVVECNVICNIDEFPEAAMAKEGAQGVKTFGGMTLMYFHDEGKRHIVKSVVCAAARAEVVRHEVIHAYCHQTFGRIGPVWYSEGMAELGHYWQEGDTAVHADAREIDFLHRNPPKSLTTIVSPAQTTGDCWQNYATSWALCHFLYSNPNYARQFQQFGRGLMAGKNVSLEQTYVSVSRELLFEYLFFIQHISRDYRVDLCAWNWKKKFTELEAGHTQKVDVAAGRGWQPSGVNIRAGTRYEYLASGTWQIAGQPAAVSADGDAQHRGRLVGVLLKDHQLGPEFELGGKGSLRMEGGGDLYLRCRNAWNELAGDNGRVTVTFQLQGQNPP
jgi:hypothetical protein